MTKTIVVKNPTESQVNILLPKFGIDLKISPKSESDPLSEVVLKHIQPYVKAFKLEVVHAEAQVVAAKVAPTQAEVKLEAPKAPEVTIEQLKVEATVTESTENTQSAPAEGTQEASASKKYEESELYALLKADLITLCTEKGLDASGTKEDLIKRILESQM